MRLHALLVLILSLTFCFLLFHIYIVEKRPLFHNWQDEEKKINSYMHLDVDVGDFNFHRADQRLAATNQIS